jgi:trimethylamine:corrinoid methyltransferase-like protein
MLRDYEPPSLDAAVAEELHAFVERRRSELRAGRARSDWKR